MRNDETSAFERARTLPRWSRVTAGNAALVALALVVLAPLWPDGPTAGFLVAVGVVLGLESLLVVGLLEGWGHVDAPNEQPVTLATWVTLARGGAVAVLAGFTVTGSPSGTGAWVPAALFAVAAALDAFDGVLARATDSVTDLGSRLDVEIDGLVVLVGTLVAVVDGTLPVVFLVVAGSRYLFVAGRWWRRRRNRPVSELPANPLRRPLGALAMVAVWLALLPILSSGVSHAFATLVLVPFLANFCWDWLAVTGRVGSE